MANGNSNNIIKWITFGLAIIGVVVGCVLYIARIERCSAEQKKDIERYSAEQQRDYSACAAVDADHENRLRKLEDAMREISEQKSILERILNAVEDPR